jgi:hypothetical protein
VERSKELQLLERIMNKTTDQSDFDSLMKIAKIVYKHDHKERNTKIEKLSHLLEGISSDMVSMTVNKKECCVLFRDRIEEKFLAEITLSKAYAMSPIHQSYYFENCRFFE